MVFRSYLFDVDTERNFALVHRVNIVLLVLKQHLLFLHPLALKQAPFVVIECQRLCYDALFRTFASRVFLVIYFWVGSQRYKLSYYFTILDIYRYDGT